MAIRQMIAFLLLSLLATTASSAPPPPCYTSLFTFGDSATATGIYNTPGAEPHRCSQPPYGETYFHKPTGRCTDGRTIVDFLAQHLGLPLLPPYHGEPVADAAPFRQGANFAVVSATVMDFEFLKGRGITSCQNCSLSVQLARFKTLLGSLCKSPAECREYLKSTLIVLGEIGGVDYMRAALQIRDSGPEAVEGLMPLVVGKIGSAMEEIIQLGAVNFLVPGDFPKGCFPAYLTDFPSNDKSAYDPLTGCLIYHNGVSSSHNAMLRDEIQRVQNLHPDVSIHYADYYGPTIRMVQDPVKYGMDKATVNKACCGAGGPYNFVVSAKCGKPGAVSCPDPKRYVMWDDHHCTEAANAVIATEVVRGPSFGLACRGKQPAPAPGKEL
ncbi:unnamed protein product [Linum tenue]|uniref:GDSL esterase/lipase n=1 Tax=Linum tenue TaxID=586396 RepID=A0AAV0QIN0_9ROSI|nr:unnamed protein product [Linum tenue]